MRDVYFEYQDPLELVWTESARAFGITVKRDPSVFASWDGAGTLRIGTPESLDADDSLAQMIFHELCHAMIEGHQAWNLPDWGLDIDNPKQRVNEHACLRLQAALADRHGLRQFLAATTNFREYYDRLPPSPLEIDGDPAVPMALAGFQRASRGPWRDAFELALRKTSEIAQTIREIAPVKSLWRKTNPAE